MSGALPRRALRRMRRALGRCTASRRFVRTIRLRRSPAEKWDVQRRLMLCAAVASATFMLVTYGWRLIDASDRAAREAAVDALEQRLRESRGKLARLPQLREAARSQPALPDVPARAAGGDWQAVAGLASRAGMTLRALGPASAAAARAGSGAPAARALRVEGRADFRGLYAFLSGLSTLPMLAVPNAVEIKPDNGELALGATLDIFDMPPVQAAPELHALGQAAQPIVNPFGDGAGGTQANASAGRLVGVVHDGRRALALFEPASGLAIVLMPGQKLGADRLVRIDADGVVLAARAGTRKVPLEKERR